MKKRPKKSRQNRVVWAVAGIIGLVVILAWAVSKWGSRTPLDNPTSYVRRTYDTTASGEHIAVLNSITDTELVPFRCTMQYINNGENTYFWRLTTQHDLFDQVEDAPFLAIIGAVDSSLPENRMLISGRFCETQNGMIYADYYTADRTSSYVERGYYNGSEVEGYLTSFDAKTGSHLPPIKFTTKKIWPYTGCKEPLQISTNGTVYLSCGGVEAYNAINTIYEINVPSATIVELQTCTYTRDSEVTKTCTLNKGQY